MKKLFKKQLSLILALTLVVGLLPTSMAIPGKAFVDYQALQASSADLLAQTNEAADNAAAPTGGYWATAANRAALASANATAAGIGIGPYDSGDYDILADAITAFNAVRGWKPANTTLLAAAIDDAINAKAAVKAEVDPALVTDEQYYTGVAEANLDDAISASQDVLINNAPGVVTQAIADQAVTTMNSATALFNASLERKTNKTNLQTAINTAISVRDLTKLSTDVLAAGDKFVTPEQKATLQNAIDSANTVYNNKKAFQLDVNNAAVQLGTAEDDFAGLVKTASNKAVLQSVKTNLDAQVARLSTEALKANVTDADYWAPAANRANLLSWQTAVGNVLAQAAAEQNLVDDIAEDATTFLSGFNSVVQDVRNLGALNTSISDAESAMVGVVRSDTPADVITTKQCVSTASYDALANAITAAKATQSDPTKLQLDIQSKLTALNTARGTFTPTPGTLEVNDKATLTGLRASIATMINIAQISDFGDVQDGAMIWKTLAVRTAFLDALAELDAAIATPVYDEQAGSLAFKRLNTANTALNADLVLHVVDNTAALQTASNILLAIQAIEESAEDGDDVDSSKKYIPVGQKSVLLGRQQTLVTAINSATRTQNLLQAWIGELTALSTYISTLPDGKWGHVTGLQWNTVKTDAESKRNLEVYTTTEERLDLLTGTDYTVAPHQFNSIFTAMNSVTYDEDSWQIAKIYREQAALHAQSNALVRAHHLDLSDIVQQKLRFDDAFVSMIVAADNSNVPHGKLWCTPAEKVNYDHLLADADDICNNGTAQTQRQINTATSNMAAVIFRVANVNTSSLNNVITVVEEAKASTFTSTNGTDIEPTASWTSTAAHTTLADAITQAKAARDSANRTMATVDAALTSLQQSYHNFDSTTHAGTGPARADLELGLVTKYNLINTELFGGNVFLSPNGQDILSSKAHIAIRDLVSAEQYLSEFRTFVVERATASYENLRLNNSRMNSAINDVRNLVANPTGQLASIDDTAPPTLINLDIQTSYPAGSKLITVAAEVNETCAVTVALYPINAPIITDPVTAFNASDSTMYKKTLASPNHLISAVFENLPVNGAYRVYVMAKDQNGNITPIAPRVTEKQNANAPVAPIGIRVLTQGGTGKIIHVNNTMEYKLFGADHYTAVTGTEVTGLAPGNYVIRYKATDTHHASTTMSVAVAPYVAPPTPPTPPTPSRPQPPREDSKVPTGTAQNLVVNGKVVDVVAKGIIDNKVAPVAKLPAAQNTLEVSSAIVDQLADTKLPLVVSKENVTYTVPAAVIDRIPEGSRLVVEVTQAASVPKQIISAGLQTLAPPVQFRMTTFDAKGNATEFNRHDYYIERTIGLAGTGTQSGGPSNPVVVTENPDGTLRSVPTRVDGSTVSFRSLSNSVYTVIDSSVSVPSVKGTWAEKAINNMASKMVLEDVKNFEPNKKLTRGEFAEYIVKAMGLAPSSKMSNLKDVTTKTEQNGYIATAVNYGLAKGFNDKTFKPNGEITRAEMAVMIANANAYVKFIGSKQAVPRYSDLSSIPKWASAMKSMVEYGIYTGYEDNTIRPNARITHAEALQVIDSSLRLTELIN